MLGDPQVLITSTKRAAAGLDPIPFLLSDIRPHPSWPALKAASPTQHLSYIPHSVDATSSANIADPAKVQVRTLFVSFHHMDQEGARKVLEDAMRNAESLVYALCTANGLHRAALIRRIVEMSDFSFAGCILGPVAFIPMSWIFTPRLKPSWAVLLFTYLIPLIPLMFYWDALVSGYRTYAPHHILHLSSQAQDNVNAARVREFGEKAELVEWEWEFGRQVHTKPSAMMNHAIGKRVHK